MRAVVLDNHGLRLDTDYPSPQAAPGEVLIRVLRAGICETDLQLIAGYMAFRGVLGHEFVGVAESGRYRGQRVVGEINCSCRQCEYCQAGLGRHCPNRSVLGILNHDGAFADLIAVPEANLHLVPESLSDETAVFNEPLAAAFEIPEQLDLSGYRRAVVLGDGRLGNLCAQVIARSGCDLTVIGKHRAKLALLERLGIATELLGNVEPRREADLVVDCTGSPTGLETALGLVRPRGTIVMKTTVAAEHASSLAPLVIDEITLVGSRCGPFDKALAALAAGDIDVQPLVSGTYALDDALEALHRAQAGSVLKLQLVVRQ
jgi:threonine dehydrogenase-like Zn-dependent dehydrogenase